MAEIARARIKTIYGEIRGYRDSLSEAGGYSVLIFTVDNFNYSLDNLSEISETDYSRYKVSSSYKSRYGDYEERYDVDVVKMQLGAVLSRLEAEYDFRTKIQPIGPNIAIFNENHNKVSVQINYTINDLIESNENPEVKEKLKELDSELNKPQKNWEKIKPILLWIINFSKDLFLDILPIILKSNLGE